MITKIEQKCCNWFIKIYYWRLYLTYYTAQKSEHRTIIWSQRGVYYRCILSSIKNKKSGENRKIKQKPRNRVHKQDNTQKKTIEKFEIGVKINRMR